MSRAYETDEDRKIRDEQAARERARESRARLCAEIAASLRKTAASILIGAAQSSDPVETAARLDVGHALSRWALKAERGDLS